MTEPAEVKTILDGLTAPTADETYTAVREYDTRDVMAAVGSVAKAGGGGTPDLGAVLAQGGDPDGNPVTGQLTLELVDNTVPSLIDTPPAGSAAAFALRAMWQYENAASALSFALAQYGLGDHFQFTITDQGNPAQGITLNSDEGVSTRGDANGYVARRDDSSAIFKANGTVGVLTSVHAAPADGDINDGEMAIWFDQTNGSAKLMVKAKQADGSVKTGSLSLT